MQQCNQEIMHLHIEGILWDNKWEISLKFSQLPCLITYTSPVPAAHTTVHLEMK